MPDQFEIPEPHEMSYRKACLIFGNGDFHRGQQNIFMLAHRLEEARKKHPHFAEGVYQALEVIGAEYQEFVHAVEHETLGRQLDEALDVAAATLRFINREYKLQTHVIQRG